MNEHIIFLELLLAGFFAVACIKSRGADQASGKVGFSDVMRLPDRWERLRRSRWQWFSMVLLMVVLRVQNELPLVLEITVLFQFFLFMALPTINTNGREKRRQGNAAIVGDH
jgi:hypothetical protein